MTPVAAASARKSSGLRHVHGVEGEGEGRGKKEGEKEEKQGEKQGEQEEKGEQEEGQKGGSEKTVGASEGEGKHVQAAPTSPRIDTEQQPHHQHAASTHAHERGDQQLPPTTAATASGDAAVGNGRDTRAGEKQKEEGGEKQGKEEEMQGKEEKRQEEEHAQQQQQQQSEQQQQQSEQQQSEQQQQQHDASAPPLEPQMRPSSETHASESQRRLSMTSELSSAGVVFRLVFGNDYRCGTHIHTMNARACACV